MKNLGDSAETQSTGTRRGLATLTWSDVCPARGRGAVRRSIEAPGVVLGNKYRLVQRIGAGSMGSIWRAEHVVLRAPVAVKFMRASLGADEDARRRFLQEARIAAAMSGPHVVRVLDYAWQCDVPYLVMELLEGESLGSRLARAGPLSAYETGRVIRQLAGALACAHRLGVVHRDIKPENVFLVRQGGNELVKLLDFGVARACPCRFGIALARVTQPGDVVGTPQYMSPEQALGAATVDHRSDVWALGVVAFECLLGRPPLAAGGQNDWFLQLEKSLLPVPSSLGLVPSGFDEWFRRACARDPAQRFASVEQAAAAFRAGRVATIARSRQRDRYPQAGAARPPSLPPPSGVRQRRGWGWGVIVAVTLAAVLGGAVSLRARRAGAAASHSRSGQEPLRAVAPDSE